MPISADSCKGHAIKDLQ